MSKSYIWNVEKLVQTFKNGQIIRPKIQRQQCWDETPAGGRTNNEDFIKFIRGSRNVVSPFIFVEIPAGYVLIDGNNRLNAIVKNYCVEDSEIEVPIVLFPQLKDDELISLYEKINITGVKLSQNDLLAAKASCRVYDGRNLRDFHQLYANHSEYIKGQQLREILEIPLSPFLTSYEAVAAKQRILSSLHPWMETPRGFLFEYAERRGILLEREFDLNGFLAEIDGQIARIGAFSAKYGELGAPQMRCAFIECCEKKYLHAAIYSLLRARKGGAPSPERAVAKGLVAYSACRTTKQITLALSLPSPSISALRKLIELALSEVAAEKSSPKRRATPRIYTILLDNFHGEMMPAIHAAKPRTVEHIIPFSTQFLKTNPIDISRLGNLTIIPQDANCSRGNSPLSAEYLEKYSLHYAGYPTLDEYHEIVDGRRLISPEKYNKMAAKREDMYISRVLGRL